MEPDAAVEARRLRRLITGIVIAVVALAVVAGGLLWNSKRDDAEKRRRHETNCAVFKDAGLQYDEDC